MKNTPIQIVGGGPTGALLAILLHGRGHSNITLYENRADPRLSQAQSGRSINLALADRGIHALKTAGVFERLDASLLAMRGRCIHHLDGSTVFQPYGQRPNEVIYSISRHKLNQNLIDIAAGLAGVSVHFEHRLEAVDFSRQTAAIRDMRGAHLLQVPMLPLIAADGAGSTMRRRMHEAGFIDAHETDLDHGYKELSVPASGGRGAFAEDALHIWPRGNYMLIALPNEDHSFTATLFLQKQGRASFESLQETGDIDAFLSGNFPDARAAMPDCVREFKEHPVGFLGSVSASPWNASGQALLIGDAAHAIVPFHGQGMNCCFEDCIELDQCVARNSSWEAAFREFGASRKPNTDAITTMALENYREMREQVADPKFQLQQALALELEKRFPRRFIPRYSMVMHHHEIPYLTAQQRGLTQTAILEELTAGNVSATADVDFMRAEREIMARLPPV